MQQAISFSANSPEPAVSGFLHAPDKPNNDALVLTHGAGGNCSAPLLVALSEIFAEHGYTVLRCDLPFRQERCFGPPFPGNAERDRAGLLNAVSAMRERVRGRVFLGGQSYGGRQATMLCAAESVEAGQSPVPTFARARSGPPAPAGLLLLSYPLHPPRKPEQLRTQHLPKLHTPCLFVQGTRDPFGSIEEIKKALELIPAKHELLEVEGAGHDLGFAGGKRLPKLPSEIVAAFEPFLQ